MKRLLIRIFNNKDGCLRSTLQIFIAALTFLSITLFGQGIIGTAIYRLTESGVLPSSIWENYFITGALPETVLNFLAGGLLLLIYRLMNKKTISHMGVTSLGKGKSMILYGICTMLLVLSVITLVLVGTGDIYFTGFEFHLSLLQYIMVMTSVSFVEETLNRGYIQHLVADRSSVFLSLIISSLVFMSFHLQNPDMTKLGLFNIFLAGVFFSVVTYRTGSIWFAFGAHIIWNVGSGCIFGLMAVSQTTGTLLNFEYIRETIFNGYAVSPLYGVIGTVTYVILIVLFGFVIPFHKHTK